MRRSRGKRYWRPGLKRGVDSAGRTTARHGGRARRLAARLLGVLAIAAAALVLLGLAPPSAAADGSYRVLECYPPSAPGAPDVRTSGSIDGVHIKFISECGSASGGHGVALYPYSGYSGSPIYAAARLDAPPTTYFNAGRLYYQLGQNWSSPWGHAAYIGDQSGHPVWTLATPGTGATYAWPSCGTCTRIWIAVSCASFCVHNDSPPWTYDFVRMRELDLTVNDTRRPVLVVGGSLFRDSITHGSPKLRIVAADAGGGVRGTTVEVNGVVVAGVLGGCPGIKLGASYATRVRPCGDQDATVSLDTERTPWRDGSNTLRVCASDVATPPGAPNTTCQQRTVLVDNSCPDSSGASGRAQSISAGLEDPRTGQLRRARSVRSSDGVPLRGQLGGTAGPVRGASVCIYETVDEPAGIEQLVQVAKTTSSGRFAVQLPPGPSRAFRVAYRYADGQIQSPRMYLDSSVKPFLKVNRPKLRNGQAVRFRGRIPGPHAAGRGVTLQARVGRKWRSFKQLQTNDLGAFRGRYRFTQTHGLVRYVFRALVKRQGGYPYSPGASKKRRVLVRG
jgi:hypothetical protein